jgi:hypothetical protein
MKHESCRTVVAQGRASTPFLSQDVDGRDEPGHDVLGFI